MNYTKMIKKYCEERPGETIDIGTIAKERFNMVPYKTLSKCLGRLQKERLLTKIRSGVYRVAGGEGAKPPFASYLEDGRGVEIGYGLYRQLGITQASDGITRIVTNAISVKEKKVLGAILEKADVPYFGREEKQMIALLEILRNGYKIEGLDYFAYDDVCRKLCWTYTDYALRSVLKHRKYPSSTICSLDERLKALGRETNCLRIYEEIYGI